MMNMINFKSPMVWAVAGLALWLYTRKSCDCKK